MNTFMMVMQYILHVFKLINSIKYTMLDFTPQTLWVVAAVVLGQSHVILNWRTLAQTGCKQKNTSIL